MSKREPAAANCLAYRLGVWLCLTSLDRGEAHG
jgi:hypothetical protein